jgi:hypothetical protein
MILKLGNSVASQELHDGSQHITYFPVTKIIQVLVNTAAKIEIPQKAGHLTIS